MGFDYRVRFDEPAWYAAHRERVLEHVRGLPHVVPVVDVGSSVTWQPTDSEVWLLAPLASDPPEAWPYDVRVFIRDELRVEVSRFGEAYFVDVRHLDEWLRGQTPATLVDDDGEPVQWPS